jgi:AAA15 family ATPase/GTPase
MNLPVLSGTIANECTDSTCTITIESTNPPGTITNMSNPTTARLEEELKSANNKYDMLKLDYDVAVSELDTLKTSLTDTDPWEKIMEVFRKIKADRDRYKGLYEAARTDEAIIQYRIRNAVRFVEAKKDAEIDATKCKAELIFRDLEEKLLAAETRAEEAEKWEQEVSDIGGINKVLIARNEKIMALYEENDRLVQKNNTLVYEKTRFAKEILDKMGELHEKNAELESKQKENARLNKALASVLE